MSKKDKKIIIIAQCIINPYCRVHILGQNFPLTIEVTNGNAPHSGNRFLVSAQRAD